MSNKSNLTVVTVGIDIGKNSFHVVGLDRRGELYPRVGFIVTNLARPPARTVAFYNQRGTAEQWIKEGKGAIKWTRLSCRSFAANAVRLQLHVLAYNLGNFMRTVALPKTAELWSLTSLREKLIKIGAKVVSHGRYVTFQMADRGAATEVPGDPVADRPAAGRHDECWGQMRTNDGVRGAPQCRQSSTFQRLGTVNWRF
jgi:hypothetical protein